MSSAMKPCCKNMTPVTFQGLSNRNSRPYPYHDEPAQLNMEWITATWQQGLTEMLVTDKEYVMIGRTNYGRGSNSMSPFRIARMAA